MFGLDMSFERGLGDGGVGTLITRVPTLRIRHLVLDEAGVRHIIR